MKRSASQKQIRLGYFSQAKKHHPDLNSHKTQKDYDLSNKKFQQINDAYQILSDHTSKMRYDGLTNNLQANNSDFNKAGSTSQPGSEQAQQAAATGHYSGFYERVLQKKREAQSAIFDEPKHNRLDLDAELQKLEKLKEMRRSKMEEHRDKRN